MEPNSEAAMESISTEHIYNYMLVTIMKFWLLQKGGFCCNLAVHISNNDIRPKPIDKIHLLVKSRSSVEDKYSESI